MEDAWWSPILGTLLSLLVAAAIPALLAWLWKWLQARGIEIEGRHREALHSALETAARALIARYGGTLRETPLNVATTEAKEVIEDASRSVPDAFKYLGIDKGTPGVVLQNLAMSKLQKVIAEIRS